MQPQATLPTAKRVSYLEDMHRWRIIPRKPLSFATSCSMQPPMKSWMKVNFFGQQNSLATWAHFDNLLASKPSKWTSAKTNSPCNYPNDNEQRGPGVFEMLTHKVEACSNAGILEASRTFNGLKETSFCTLNKPATQRDLQGTLMFLHNHFKCGTHPRATRESLKITWL